MRHKPFSQACENNKLPISELLGEIFADRPEVLELGSGTGQHAVFMAAVMPWLQWYCSDRKENHSAIQAWLDDASLDNVQAPLELDIGAGSWPVSRPYQAIFTANTLHIMAWREVEQLFSGLQYALAPGGKLCIYGPFNYRGSFTSESNAAFDQWLKRLPGQGIRDFEAVCELASNQGLELQNDYEMPANNRLVYWLKVGDSESSAGRFN